MIQSTMTKEQNKELTVPQIVDVAKYFEGQLFTRTNEVLEAIVAGMDLQVDDNVLAVCGAGDQAITILEYAKKVITIDQNSTQIDIARCKTDLLKKGAYEEFRSLSYSSSFLKINYDYFTGERLGRISKKRSQLRFMNLGLENIGKFGETFDKVYLSNAFLWECEDKNRNTATLNGVLSTVHKEGIIYFTNGFETEKFIRGTSELTSRLTLDIDLTKKARDVEKKYGCWDPSVFRKI